MPRNQNGRAISDQYSDIKECARRSSIPEDSPTEPMLRGFCKAPKVALPRIDLSPYLKGSRKQNSRPNGLKLLTHGHSINWDELTQCKVLVARSDLIKLRKEFINNTETDSDSDSTDMQTNGFSAPCKICKKVYSSEKKLQNHMQNKHIIYKPQNSKPQKRVSFSDKVIIHEVKEYHKCRKCPKIFENYKTLKIHMKLRHKKRKCYICNYCGKRFVDRMFFKVHIKLHCDVCGSLLPSKKKLIEHRRGVCRVLKTHKCKTCEDTFFKFMDLKDHSYDHNETISYICDICKDLFANKCALGHHLAFLHSKRRPKSLYIVRNLGSERLYLCNFCDESSVDRDVIESHTGTLPDLTNRAMTGYKDYYFCDQCMKKFDTESAMLQHKWSHFLKTSDNSQLRPKGILTNASKKYKTKYNINEDLPSHFKPTISLERLNLNNLNSTSEFVDMNSEFVDVNSVSELKKPVVDPKSKKTIISRHRCETCGKYYSSNYCLNRHIETQHHDFENLQCKVCEEHFYWPSLLKSHKCIRLHTEDTMPFDDARPEIHFDNLHDIITPAFDDFNIIENDDYINNIDFEIPAPIVELSVGENIPVQDGSFDSSKYTLQHLGYKVVAQEVPIEF